MTNQELLAEIIDSGEVPARVTNRLLLEAIIGNSKKTDKAINLIEVQNGRILRLENRTQALEVRANDYPTMVQLIKDNPANAFRFSIFILFVLFVLHTLESQLMPWIFALLKMAAP